jgi:hypothetical protein
MKHLDCPFRVGEKEVELLRKETNIILVDFHAEALQKKWRWVGFLNGKVSAVLGTHTHVQTAFGVTEIARAVFEALLAEDRVKAYVGVTDFEWFSYLSAIPGIDEVNFWQPGGKQRFRALTPGDPFLFKLR